MKTAFSTYQLPTTTAPSERAELVKFFFDNLQKPYLEYTGRKLTPRLVAIKLAHLKLQDLYYLKSICKDSDNFARTFWGAIKVK